MLPVSVEHQNNKKNETPQLSFKAVASTSISSNTTGFSLSSQVTSSMSKTTNLFSFTPASITVQPLLFGAGQIQPRFEDQSAVTPVKIHSPTKPLLEDISTISISKSQQSNTKSLSDDKYSSIFSSLSTPQNTASLPTQVKPIVISTPANKTVVENKIATPTPTIAFAKPDLAIGYKTESNIMNKPVTTFLSKLIDSSVSNTEVNVISKPDPELSKIDTDDILQQMIKEDCISLEAELKNVGQKTKSININLGSESDKIEMLNIIRNLEEFQEDISEISIGELSEVGESQFVN